MKVAEDVTGRAGHCSIFTAAQPPVVSIATVRGHHSFSLFHHSEPLIENGIDMSTNMIRNSLIAASKSCNYPMECNVVTIQWSVRQL